MPLVLAVKDLINHVLLHQLSAHQRLPLRTLKHVRIFCDPFLRPRSISYLLLLAVEMTLCRRHRTLRLGSQYSPNGGAAFYSSRLWIRPS